MQQQTPKETPKGKYEGALDPEPIDREQACDARRRVCEMYLLLVLQV